MNLVRGSHAVVIGGSMAGILTARALSEHFDDVTVLERDRLPEGPEFRKGVPHGRQVHTFWVGGLRAVDQLLPGIEQDLLDAGAVRMNLPTDLAWLTPAQVWGKNFPARQSFASASRPLIEWTVRRRVAEAGNIRFLPRCDVTGIHLDGDGNAAGVHLVRREGGELGHLLPADLVVDASGRGSRLPEWLAAHGIPGPEESMVDCHLGYATRIYAIPEGFEPGWRAAYIQNAPPRHPRGAVLFPIEENRWVVTMMGGGGDYPPTDQDGWLEFARSLRSPLVYDAVAGAEPVSPIHGYRRTANRRRHYERLDRMPGRLLVIGDSLTAFNPVYGQGMTVAAMQVRALHASLRRTRRGADLVGRTHRIQRRIARCADAPWLLSTGSDLRYDGVEGARATAVTRLQHRYLDRVLAAAAVDPYVNGAFLRVLNMLAGPEALFHPRVLTTALSSAGRPNPVAPPAPYPSGYPSGVPSHVAIARVGQP